MRRLDLNGIRFGMWRYYALFSICILSLLWLMQIVFVDSFYEWIKTANIRKTSAEVAALYTVVRGQALAERLKSLADDNDLFINITDTNGKSKYAIGPVGRDYRTPAESIHSPAAGQSSMLQEGFSLAAERILAQPNGIWTHVFSDQQGRRMLLLGKQIQTFGETKELLMITAPLQPLRDTVRIIKQQLLIISAVLLLLSLGLSSFVSERLSQPLRDITKKAGRLASGDYAQTFDDGKYTEISQLSKALNHLSSELTQVERLRSELIGNVSHDLRTPLTMIRVYAEMTKDIDGENKLKREKNLSIIIEESDRLSRLVQDLLDLSVAQSGNEAFSPVVFDIADMIQRVLIRYEPLVSNDGYNFDFARTAPKFVYAEPARIEQVIYNLLNNAINHTGPDKRIHIVLRDNLDTVLCSITDSGKGVAPENMDKIWDRYFKDNEGRLVVGTGLGLSIVKSILGRHGMRYGVESVSGVGATFWFELKKRKD